MNEGLVFFGVLAAGIGLGLLFFGGLWWTVRKGLSAAQPAFWFFGSSVLRTAAVLAGFYFVGRGDWRKLIACLIGFVVGRLIVARIARQAGKGTDAP
jgi:F1F0 ATPase subunit 2